jgi:hypothetical protein
VSIFFSSLIICIKIYFVEPITPLPTVQQPQPTQDRPRSPITPLPTVQQSQPTQDRPRSPISLPFTYTKTREETLFPNNYRQLSAQPTLEKIIEINDNAMQTTSSVHNTEQVVQNNTEIQHTLHKREDPKQFNPLLCSKITVNRSFEFHRFRSISSRNYMTLSNKNMTIHIPVIY